MLKDNFLQNIANDEYERNFVSAVVAPGEIGVKFEDIGALEDVKKALNELVILPMRRPELFTRGNLLRVLLSVWYIALFSFARSVTTVQLGFCPDGMSLFSAL